MTSPTAPSPGLGEREAVARTLDPYAWECWEEIQQPHYGSYGLSGEPEGRLEDSTCARWQHAVRGAGMLAKSLAKADAIIAQHIAPLRTENESLRAELDQAAWAIADRNVELDTVEAELITLRAERDAAIARAEEAKDRVVELGEYIIDLEHLSYIREDLTWRDEASRLRAKLAQAEGEIATMRERAAEVCSIRASVWQHHIGKPSETSMDEQVVSLFENAAAAIRALSLTEAGHDANP